MVDDKKLQLSFFFIALALASIVTFLVYRPFLEVLLVAAILAVLLDPLMKRAVPITGGSRSIAAAIVLLTACVFFALPLYLLGVQVFNESKALYMSVQGTDGGSLSGIADRIDLTVNRAFPELSFNIRSYAGAVVSFISQNIGPLVTGTAFALFEILLTLIALFFFLKDGPLFVQGYKQISPLNDRYDDEILTTLHKTINSVLRGELAVSFLQGSVLACGFLIFGVPNAFLWGILGMVLAFLPGVGTGMIYVPGIIYLIYGGHMFAGVGLGVWSFFLHGSVDNFVAPYFYSRGAQLHPLFVMFSVIGGIVYFGPLGFLFGPIILSAFVALLRVYRMFVLKPSEDERA